MRRKVYTIAGLIGLALIVIGWVWTTNSMYATLAALVMLAILGTLIVITWFAPSEEEEGEGEYDDEEDEEVGL